MEQKLQRSRRVRKTKNNSAGKVIIAAALAIPALVGFISIRNIGIVSANSLETDNNSYKDLGNEVEKLGLNELFHSSPKNHQFGLNVITIKTPEESFNHFTEKNLVTDIVREVGLEYDQDDILMPLDNDVLASGAKITLIRVENEKIDEVVAIPFDIVYEDDPTIDKGVDQIYQEGNEGEKLITYLAKYENGELVSKETIEEEILTPPANRIIKVGTRKPIPHSTLDTGTCDSWDKVIDELTADEEERGWLKGLMRCESGCNAGRVSYNGTYHGLFQFHPKTFEAYGGTNIYDGHQQLPIVLNWVKAGVQYTQFPACSRGH